MRSSNIVFVVLIYLFSIHLSNEDDSDNPKNLLKGFTPAERTVLEDIARGLGSRFVSGFVSSQECYKANFTCKMCVSFQLAGEPHKICLVGGFLLNTLSAFFTFSYDSRIIWIQHLNFNSICTGLPQPLNKVSVCLQAYNITFLDDPGTIAICLRIDLILILPIIGIDLNCIKFKTGKGLFLDRGVDSRPKALIEINIDRGKSSISFNDPILWEDIKSILSRIQADQGIFLKYPDGLEQMIQNLIREHKLLKAIETSVKQV